MSNQGDKDDEHDNATSFKPFEPKPKHLKAEYIKRKEKWEEMEDNIKPDTSHRRFGLTLHTTQVVKSFKKCVHANEVKREELITCYRVVLQKILQDPDLSDEEFISMYKQIQSRAEEVYSRRSRMLRTKQH